MAKVTQPLSSSEARGAVGGFVYNTWRGISTVRSRVTPKNEFTTARVALQDLMTEIAGAWKNLTQQQRLAWHDFAAQHVECDWTGVDKHLTAWNWWIRIQARRSFYGLPQTNDPPIQQCQIRLSDLATYPSLSYMTITWNVDIVPPPSIHVIEVWVTNPLSPGRQATIKDAHFETTGDPLDESYTFVPASIGQITVFARPLSTDAMAGDWRRASNYWPGPYLP